MIYLAKNEKTEKNVFGFLRKLIHLSNFFFEVLARKYMLQWPKMEVEIQ